MIVCSRPPERGRTDQFFGSKIATFYPLRYERAQSDSVSAHPSMPDHAAQLFEAAKWISARDRHRSHRPLSQTCFAAGALLLSVNGGAGNCGHAINNFRKLCGIERGPRGEHGRNCAVFLAYCQTPRCALVDGTVRSRRADNDLPTRHGGDVPVSAVFLMMRFTRLRLR